MLVNRRQLRRHFRMQNVITALFLWIVVSILTIRDRPSVVDDEPLSADIQKVFISALHWNNEPILRSHWNAAVVELVKSLGPANVFISIHESGSWDDTKGALRELDFQLGVLGVSRMIILDNTTHADEISSGPSGEGWIKTPRGRAELRRIPYLARLRNLTLRPLQKLYDRGWIFDRILFRGDVVFTVRGPFASRPSALADCL